MEARTVPNQLNAAIRGGKDDQWRQLLNDYRGNINSLDENGQSPLSVAAMCNREEAIRELLKRDGINIEWPDKDGKTPLSVAAYEGAVETTELLLKKGANVNTKELMGRTPLSLVVQSLKGEKRKMKKIVNLLLDSGASTDEKDNDDHPPIWHADTVTAQLLLLSPRMHRRLIVCCDGTWNDRETKQPFTNVTRIQSCLEATDDRDQQHYEQISFYIDGIGTDTTLWGKYWTGATGIGISHKIGEAYRFLCSTYTNEGDQIVLIGFSRGAFTIQCLAKLINDIGLISNEVVNTEFPEIFRLWSEGDGTDPLEGYEPSRNDDPSSSEVEGANHEEKISLKGRCQQLADVGQLRRNVRIHAYAAWDTVKSLVTWRGKSRFTFVNEQLSPNIKDAFHALALDEMRYHFQPLILRKPPASPPDLQLKQCWFLGSHGDVGGGCENSGLANISLCWMVSQLSDHLQFNEKACCDVTEAGSILKIDMKTKNRDIEDVEKYNSVSGIWRVVSGFTGLATRTVGKVGGYESIHSSVRYVQGIAKKAKKSESLKSFKYSLTSNNFGDRWKWTATVQGEEVVIWEDEMLEWEYPMLEAFFDRHPEFKKEFGGIRNNRPQSH